MFDYQIEEHNKYKMDYDEFVNLRARENIYEKSANSVFYNSEILSLLKYDSRKIGGEIFIIVPSIFNSPEILFLNKEENFVENLQKKGDVYIVNWLENEAQLLLEDYIREIIAVLEIFKNKPLHLIGHCIGGNISIAATSLTKKSNVINSLTLLTTPWDYSHFNKWAYIYKSLNMEMALMNYNFVPVIYTQIMFFLMFPMQFAEKIKKYFSLTSSRAKNLFMQVESWLQSGNKISKSIYMQIINEFCLQNILFKKQWYIDGNLVDLKDIEIPVCIIHAKDDQITTYKAMNPLQEQIKDSTLIEVEGGHIGYLINNKSQFQNHYNAWLDNQIQGNEICNTSI